MDDEVIGLAATLVGIFFILIVSYVSYECGWSGAAEQYERIVEQQQETIDALTAPRVTVLD